MASRGIKTVQEKGADRIKTVQEKGADRIRTVQEKGADRNLGQNQSTASTN